MSDPSVALRPVEGEETRNYAAALLEDAGLPTADVRSDTDWLYTARRDGERVGVGGVELHGEAGLLRSVVVAAERRGEGVGTALLAALEERAREAGVETLYLLTTTASEFFAARGYERCERGAAPEAIRETSQFRELCPASAVCLWKSL